jgi:O-acetyl-ADP-ribose deacetylase (regulator of RNase III)
MKLILKQCDILDIKAEILVCSANVSLNLTGGVGADIIKRCGAGMQEELHEMLESRTPKYASQGEVYVCNPHGLPYKTVFHAVAVNPLYNSSIQVIEKLLEKVFLKAQEFDAQSIALTALATGFGNLTLEDFAKGLKPHLSKDYPPLKELYVCQIEDYRFAELQEAFSFNLK